jgi:hypothetical protein
MQVKGVSEIIPNKNQLQIAMNRLVPEAIQIIAKEEKVKKESQKGA